MNELIEFDQNGFLRDLEYIVNIDSGSRYKEGVSKIAEFMINKFQGLGLNITAHQFDPSIAPCIEIKTSTKEPYDLLFMGHMDTVFPIGTVAQRPFSINGNTAHGPGVNDMKSGLLYIYYVVKALLTSNEISNASICIALNSDEEISSIFSRPWLEDLSRKSKHVFVIESARSDGSLVNQRKGVGRYNISITGIAAHSGNNPEQGSSAIQELGHWILALHEKTNYTTGTTVNVGLISGGTAVNVVADKAIAQVDLRFFDMKEAKNIETLMQDLVNHPRTKGVITEVSGGITRPPMNPTSQTLELCSEFEKIATYLGQKIGWTTTGGGSDGCFSAHLGVPTLDGLGPIGGGSHGVNEYILIDSIEPRFKLLYNFALYVMSKS